MSRPWGSCLPEPDGLRRQMPAITVIVSVRDIPRLCECEWSPPNYSKRQRAWRRIPDPSCPYCIRSAASRAWATPIGVAA